MTPYGAIERNADEASPGLEPDSEASPSESPGVRDSTQPARRRRKWHARVFTGCGNCRRRHVKCDEQAPSCGNCCRIAAVCDYNSQDADVAGSGDRGGSRFHFRAVTPHTAQKQSQKRKQNKNQNTCHLLPPPITTATATATTVPTSGLVLHDELYYNHFLGAVSTILIIFDTPANANPFRKLPRLADASGLLEGTMLALGALHLAQLPATAAADRSRHYRAAMTSYGSVMARLRGALAAEDDNNTASSSPGPLRLLATMLMLCLFEMMHGSDAAWQVHLDGARRIVEAMYSPRVGQARSAIGDGYSDNGYGGGSGLMPPMRRFLISLLSYLDVAGACATGEGTLIPGSYWETLGGGWEFNLGSPSFRRAGADAGAAHSGSDGGLSVGKADRDLAQLRQAWSRLMLIQSDISALEKVGRDSRDSGDSGDSGGRRDTLDLSIRHDAITRRIADWHASAPTFFALLSATPVLLDEAAAAHGCEGERELLTGTACVVNYALGCSIYLDRVASQQLHRAGSSPTIAAAVDRILALSAYCTSELHRMGHLWTLFTAGTAASSEGQRAALREILTGLQRFGFKNVSRCLDILEYIWLQQRLFGEADYNAFDQLVARTLIP